MRHVSADDRQTHRNPVPSAVRHHSNAPIAPPFGRRRRTGPQPLHCQPGDPAQPASRERPVPAVTLIDGLLAAAVLLGLVLNTTLGWWWADPTGGYVLVYYAAREVKEIFFGDH
ncbi:hypothetical protein AB0A71_06810 [Kitasatospora aureofaciens]|uniref:hypothetical protein n=1 Tax=Kitasatospora aureofaciens TaxID=1894 RepID=UPI0033C25779